MYESTTLTLIAIMQGHQQSIAKDTMSLDYSSICYIGSRIDRMGIGQ